MMLIGGEKDIEKAFTLFKKLRGRLLDAEFPLRKWKTNNLTLGEKINDVIETKTKTDKILRADELSRKQNK